MCKCSSCSGDIIVEKDGNVSLPCNHTFHPICYLQMYEEMDKDDLPVDYKRLGVCVLCILKPEKIIRSEEESVIDNMDVANYNIRTACLIVTGNKIAIEKEEVTARVAEQILTKYKAPLNKFKAVAKKYGAMRWRLESLIKKKRNEILKVIQQLTEFTIKKMSDEAYNEIIAGDEYKEFVKADREYVKHLNGLQFIDPIQYFQNDVIRKIVRGMNINGYTRKAVLAELFGDFSKRYNRSNLRGYFKPVISWKH